MTEPATNFPPADEPDPLLARLNSSYADMAARAAKLLEAERRVPDTLDDASAGKAGDFCAQVRACIKTINLAHKEEKADFLRLCRVVDGWKNGLVDPLVDLVFRVEQKLDTFMRAREAEARARKAAEAEAMRAEAAKHADTAPDKALALKLEANILEAEAEHGKAADLTRFHTSMGTTVSVRETIGFEVENHTQAVCFLAEQIENEALAKAIRTAIRAGGDRLKAQVKAGVQPIPGVTLFEDRKARI